MAVDNLDRQVIGDTGGVDLEAKQRIPIEVEYEDESAIDVLGVRGLG